MVNISQQESDLSRFMEIFKDRQGIIMATHLRDAGIGRQKTSQYRRDLMQLAIQSGDIWKSNGKIAYI